MEHCRRNCCVSVKGIGIQKRFLHSTHLVECISKFRRIYACYQPFTYYLWRFNYQKRRVRILLTDLTVPHFCACPKEPPKLFRQDYLVQQIMKYLRPNADNGRPDFFKKYGPYDYVGNHVYQSGFRDFHYDIRINKQVNRFFFQKFEMLRFETFI